MQLSFHCPWNIWIWNVCFSCCIAYAWIFFNKLTFFCKLNNFFTHLFFIAITPCTVTFWNINFVLPFPLTPNIPACSNPIIIYYGAYMTSINTCIFWRFFNTFKRLYFFSIDRANYALSKRLPLFISESAGMEATGDRSIDKAEWRKWIDCPEKNHISWFSRSASVEDETCLILKKDVPRTGTWPG